MRYLILLPLLFLSAAAHAEVGEASYYSVASCKAEGTWQKWGGKTASGEVFDDTKLTCATRGVKMGKLLKVTNIGNGKSVVVRVNDIGPNKKLYKKGRIIDLSKAAFKKIASLKSGVIHVSVENS